MKKAIILAGLLIAAMQVSAAGGNASLSLQKDQSTGLFILNMRDSQGIRSFAMVFPTDKLPYSGDLNGCPQSRKIDNVLINEISDFKPMMKAVIVDCRGEETEFEISAPVSGVAQVKKVEPPPPPPPPTPTPTPQASQAGGQAAPATPVQTSGTPENLAYPIKELGGCESQEACKTYCDAPTNLERCIAFAETNGLLTKSEIERSKKFAEIIKSGGGPGGCKTEFSCKDYCSDVGKIDECVEFAEQNGLVSGVELEEMKKIQSVARRGVKFPGECTNRAACELYCKTPEHADECVAFAKEAGFMSEDEAKEMEKILPLMRSGKMPGGCLSKEACEAYCEDERNFDECVAFAEKAGLVSAKDLEIMRKTGGKGPGGCRGRACQTFCENPANQQACFEFGKQYGLISEEDLSRMEEGKRILREQLETGPPEIQECLKSVVDVNVLESEGFMGGPELGEKMRGCFEKMIPEGMQGQFEFGPGGEFTGPGGCKSREECEAYCTANPDACGFSGGGPSGQDYVGPGGCASQEECRTYCQEHPDECQGFGNDSDRGGEECVKQGGSWNGTTCNFPGSDQGTEECAKQGGSWDGTTCNFPQIDRGAEECTKQGGNWDGKTCNFPNSQQYQQQYQEEFRKQCESRGGIWDGAQCAAPTNFQQPPAELTPGSVYDAFLRLVR